VKKTEREYLALVPVCLVLSAFVGFVCPRAAYGQEAEAQGRPAVLFMVTTHGPMWRLYLKKYIREETGQGFEMDWRTWDECDWDHVRKFNVLVVVHGFPSPGGLDKLPELLKDKAKLIARFMDEGGGVLIDPVGASRLHQWEYLLKPYGAMMYVEEVKEEERFVRIGTPFNIHFARTDNFEAHPVTKGVQNIWYPIGALKQWDTMCYPLETSSEWRVIVRGMKTSHSLVKDSLAHGKHDKVPKRAKGVSGGVPLLAVRDVGKGRMALIGIPEFLTYDAGVSPGMERTFLSRGLDGIPSDGAQLLRNLYTWFAAPSLASGALGGWKTDPERIKRAEGPPPEWRPPIRRTFPAPPKTFHALIGAQSKRSGGDSTLEEYKIAAKRADLDLLVFLEDITGISREEFARFKEDCRAASDEGVVLVPGLKIMDQSRNHYFLFGPNMPYPASSFLDSQKRYRTIDTHYVFAGQLGTIYSTALFGKYLHRQNGNPAWDIRGQQAIALATYAKGELVDRLNLEDYLAVQDAANHLEPIAIHLIQSASAVTKAATTGEQTYFYETDLSKLADNMKEPYYSPYTFTTSGPGIETWQGINCEYTGYDWFDFEGMRWAVRFALASKAGLKRVDLYDGRRRIRTFRLNGEKEFSKELSLLHEQQKDLVLVATDIANNTATSAVILDMNWLQKAYWLMDRHNHGVYCQQRNDSEWGFTYLWSPAAPGLNLYHGRMVDNLIHDINTSEIATPGLDGPPGSCTHVQAQIRIYGKEHVYDTINWANQVEQPLANQDCVIWESHVKYEYEPTPEGVRFYRGSRPASHESSVMQGYQRYVNFNIKYGMPAATLVEGEMKILQDIPLDTGRAVPILIGHMRAHHQGDTSIFAAQHTRGRDLVAAYDVHARGAGIHGIVGRLPKGAYIAMLPSAQGAVTVFSLDDGFCYRYYGHGWCDFGFRPEQEVLKKGTTLRWRYAFMTGMGRDQDATRKMETVRDVMGIDGSPGYAIALETGRVLSQEFICRLDGQQKGIAGTFPVSGLPSTLPLVIENLNDQWTAVLYERNNKRYRPIGMLADRAYVQLGVGTEDPLLFIGHPFTLDKPELWLSVVQTNAKELTIQVHNPTDRALCSVVQRSRFFDMVLCDDFEVTVPAGQTVEYLVTSGTVKRRR